MSYRDEVLRSLRVRCVHLRTKRAFLGLPEEGDRPNDVDTAVWWCARTARALGPDGSVAGPAGCAGAPRSCYAAPPPLPGSRAAPGS